MTNNFDHIIDRTATPSIKWKAYGEGVLPMWVADMDFAAPEAVMEALKARVAHGVFGYEGPPPALVEAILARLQHLYKWTVAPEALVFLPGVVTGFNLAAQAFLEPGDGLLIQTPVYPPILNAAGTANAVTQVMELTREADGRYSVDFELFEHTINERTRMFLLCNPHNPVGRVFREDELAQMAELCLRHNLLICSDEIHCDLIFSGYRHIPIAALAPEIAARTITLMAPSKTFNIAGLHCAFAVIPDAELRRRYKAARRGIVDSVNLLGYTAALAAYQQGQPWLDALLRYLEANRDFAVAFVRKHMPRIAVAPPEGTYLAWLDCRAAGLPGNAHEFFLKEARVALNDGATFGGGGEGFVRLNFGCPRALLEEGLERMRAALERICF
ncbi:MAG TPA: PatB family C-S lyase [Anaerolineae bacterium]|nr:PatB family C-S lyase [Anaerolineae bacterium]HQK15226.1 PatB family C-S lyase [Anaerolineae bacterium]